jgi:hypothetical protein
MQLCRGGTPPPHQARTAWDESFLGRCTPRLHAHGGGTDNPFLTGGCDLGVGARSYTQGPLYVLPSPASARIKYCM